MTVQYGAWVNSGKKGPVMGTKLNYDKKGRLGDRLSELRRVTVNGTRDYDQVMYAVQLLINGKYPVSAVEPSGFVKPAAVSGTFENYTVISELSSDLPDWYVHPDLQLEQQKSWLRSLGFGQGDVPTSGPVGATPTDRALPLLKIVAPGSRRVSSRRRTIDVHMDEIKQQSAAMGRKIYLWDDFKSFQEDPRLVGGLVDSEPGISWVLFDPFAHWDSQNGHRVADLPTFQDDWRLATSENLSALKVWPKYGPTMDGSKTPYINLAGYRSASGDVPYAHWWVDDDGLSFNVDSADGRDRRYASPRVRQCQY